MFNDQGQAFLVDFGLAKLLTGATNMTVSGMAMGTPSYMSPEQWRTDDIVPASPSTALFAVVLYSVWKGLGYNIVIFMAGLSSIPTLFYEAARVDGANRWQQFRHITLPLLQPTMIFVVITGIISALQVYGPIYVMTVASGADQPGGPLNSTIVVAVYQWQVAFRELRLGYGAAMGIVLFLIILVITLMQSRFLRRRWEY
jgi:multiple sugar transport system permease protein